MVVQVAGNGDALVGTILRAAAVRDGVAQVRTGGDLLADFVAGARGAGVAAEDRFAVARVRAGRTVPRR